MPNLVLAFDCRNRELILSNGGTVDLNGLHRAVYQVHIYLRQPAANGNIGSFVAFDEIGNFDGIRVGIWPTSAGEDGAELTLTDQTGWAYNTDDPDNPYWSGILDLTTPAISDAIGSDATLEAFFSVYLVSGEELYEVFDQRGGEPNCLIQQRTDPGSGNGINMTGAIPRLKAPFIVENANGLWLVNINPDGSLFATAI